MHDNSTETTAWGKMTATGLCSIDPSPLPWGYRMFRENNVNISPAYDLAPCVTRPSAGMILAI